MVYCSVINCKSNYGRKEKDVSFHRFPTDKFSLNYWVKATGRSNWQPQVHSRICSKHFEAECFIRMKKRTRLNIRSIPKLNVHNSDEINELLSDVKPIFTKAKVCDCLTKKSYKSRSSQTMPISSSSRISVPNDSVRNKSKITPQVEETTTPLERKLSQKLLQITNVSVARKKAITALHSNNWRLQMKNAKLSCLIKDLMAELHPNQEILDPLEEIDHIMESTEPF